MMPATKEQKDLIKADIEKECRKLTKRDGKTKIDKIERVKRGLPEIPTEKAVK